MRTPPAASRAPQSNTGTVSVRAVRRIVDVGAQAGVDRHLLTTVSGLAKVNESDPDARVPLASEIALWQMLAKHVSDPGFAVRGGATTRVSDVGLLGYAVCFTATVEESLRALERYSGVFSEAVEFQLRQSGPLILACALTPSLQGPAERFAQDFRLASVLAVVREITGTAVQPTEVSFTYAKPRGILAHAEFFRCPLRFQADLAALNFGERNLAMPLLRADPTLATYISRYADQVLSSLVRGETMLHKVRAAIWGNFAHGKPTVKNVAAALGVTPRTLQRQLAEQGTSLNDEIQEIRKTMAQAALRDRTVAIDDVAFLLGYAESSTFYRSFKRWTGQTPQEFRSQAA